MTLAALFRSPLYSLRRSDDKGSAQPIVKKRTVVGYRRGDGRIRIDPDTGSGDVSINPTR